MKRLLSLAIILSAGAVLAATLTIDIPNADISRITEACGSINNLGRPCTQTDVENWVRKDLRDYTQDYERRKNMAQYTPPPVSFTPAPTPTPTATAGLRAAPAAVPAPVKTATPKKK